MNWKEIGARIGLAIAIPVGCVVLAVIAVPYVLFGQPERKREILRGMSRTLNGAVDGNGDVTFSAWSYWMLLRGKTWGKRRVQFVDWITREPGHCERWYHWHKERKLFDYQ